MKEPSMDPAKQQAFADDLPRLDADLAAAQDGSNARELYGPLDPRMVRWLRAVHPRPAARARRSR